MSLNRYIIASVFLHLMLLSLLSITRTFQQDDIPIFSVRIISPLELLPPAPSMHELTDRVESQRKAPFRPRQEEVSSPPDTILGPVEPVDQDGEEMAQAQSDSGGQEDGDKGQNDRMESTQTEGDKGAATIEEGGGLRPDPYAFLFDRETIERFARRPSSDNKGGLTFDAPEFRHRGYMRMLKQRIESIWEYPRSAIRQGLSGDLYIRFSINRDGSLGEVELIRTSGHRNLDEAAMKAIRDAQPFWPLPEDWQGDKLVINGHFIYILGRTFIM